VLLNQVKQHSLKQKAEKNSIKNGTLQINNKRKTEGYQNTNKGEDIDNLGEMNLKPPVAGQFLFT